MTNAFDPSASASDTETATGSGGNPGTTEITSADDTGEPGGSCCQVSASAGCGDPQIQTCVCTIDPSCCQEVWSQECVDLAGMTCNDPGCTEPPPMTTGMSTGGEESTGSTGEPPPPTLECDELAAQELWANWRCEAGGGTQCNGVGTPTTDCDFCCELCGEPGDVSCGDYATMQGWGAANCEWNGNGACNGIGTPTCDCNFCCEVG